MLENTDTLLSMAEISAAFAGFAALLRVIRKASDQPAEAAHDLLRLRLVVSSSVAGVAAAPYPRHRHRYPEQRPPSDLPCHVDWIPYMLN